MNELFRNAVRDEAALRAALDEADIAPMLMVLVQLTGDLALMDEVAPYIHGPWSFLESVAGALKQRVRDRLVEALKDYAASGREPPARPPAELLQRMMSAGVGQPVPEEYIPLLLEEIRLGDEDPRAVRWQHEPARLGGRGFPHRHHRRRLRRARAPRSGCRRLGIPFVILEKNQDVGGTWLENEYPGCAVDTPNHFFSYSFNPNHEMDRATSRAATRSANTSSTRPRNTTLRRHIRFGVEVTARGIRRGRHRSGASPCASPTAAARRSTATR